MVTFCQVLLVFSFSFYINFLLLLLSQTAGVLLNPTDGPPKLPPVQILPPTTSTNIHPPVPLLVPKMSPPIDPSALPPSFASAGKDPQLSQTLPELMERLQLESADSLRKYTKRILHETLDNLKDSIQVSKLELGVI